MAAVVGVIFHYSSPVRSPCACYCCSVHRRVRNALRSVAGGVRFAECTSMEVPRRTVAGAAPQHAATLRSAALHATREEEQQGASLLGCKDCHHGCSEKQRVAVVS